MACNCWVLVPFITAFIGWLTNRIAIQMLFRPRVPKKILGISFQGLLPKRKEALAVRAGHIAAGLLSFNDIAERISNPAHVRKVMPQLEVHIDNFLRVKLPEQMPVISMFVGDKTIAQLKAVFMAELEVLFPVVMTSYAQQLEAEAGLEALMTAQFRAMPAERLEHMVRMALAPGFRAFAWTGAVLGFVTGGIAVLLMLLV